MSERKTTFEKFKNSMGKFIETVDKIVTDTSLHDDKEFLQYTLTSVEELRKACEAKLAEQSNRKNQAENSS